RKHGRNVLKLISLVRGQVLDAFDRQLGRYGVRLLDRVLEEDLELDLVDVLPAAAHVGDPAAENVLARLLLGRTDRQVELPVGADEPAKAVALLRLEILSE